MQLRPKKYDKMLLIDIRKAYDSVDLNKLENILETEFKFIDKSLTFLSNVEIVESCRMT